MRITNKIVDNYAVYNLNTNKALLDDLNNQMSTRKKIDDPTVDPVTGIMSLRFRGSLAEYTQYLEKNVTDAASWTDTTQSAIDTAKDIMRSLKAEYTSASNGTNESTDRWTYYDNMVNIVNEYFSVGDTTNENRYIFTGARTGDSLTFSDKNFDDRFKALGGEASGLPDKYTGTYKYAGITEYFTIDDIDTYSYTARKGTSVEAPGLTDDEISSVSGSVNETDIESVDAFRIRLAYEKLDEKQIDVTCVASYDVDEDGNIYNKKYKSTESVGELMYSDGTTSATLGSVTIIKNDYEVNQTELDSGGIYLNVTTGNLIFGKNFQSAISEKLNSGNEIYFRYNKSTWEEHDVKPEHYFDCIDVGLGTDIGEGGEIQAKIYTNKDEEQDIYYNVGENQQIKVNSRAESVFNIDARRDLNELRDSLTAYDEAVKKLNRLKEMQEDKAHYGVSEQDKITDLLRAATKEYEYAKNKLDTMLSDGITRSGNYFDFVNLAGTGMGTTVNRLNLIKNRLTEHRSTTTAQASDNENIDISTLAVQVNSATLSYSAALQVTGKISQQSLVNYL